MAQFDPIQNVLSQGTSPLEYIFNPKSIAVVGATEKERSVGRTVMQNLVRGKFPGEIYPVNPTRSEVLGVKAYPRLSALPKRPDLVVVVTPAKAVPAIIEECVAVGVPAAVIISAGFKEMGPVGEELERQVLETARRGNMRLVGPNCLGVMCPPTHLNATFAAEMALTGNVAFLSQSGALLTAVLDWSLRERVGFSAFVSLGSMADVQFADLIDYFGSDPKTEAILLYVESIGNPRAFLSAARAVALRKPIILIKAGRTEESAKAAASHTGSLAGGDAALSAALKRAGVVRVETIEELFGLAGALAKQVQPKGPRLMIVTNAGGPGVIATDALIESGGKLAQLSAGEKKALDALLPPHWSHGNPVDVLGDASADVYAQAIDIVIRDPGSDGTLVILTPQEMTDPSGTAEKLKPYAKGEKPLLASWMGAMRVTEGVKELSEAGIPCFEYPDQACRTFTAMWKYTHGLQMLYETPSLSEGAMGEGHAVVARIIAKARGEGRTILDEVESKQVVQAYGIPIVPTEVALSADQAVQAAEKMGFPIVAKLYSATITHKSDVGGVKLNLGSSDAVRRAYEEIFASVTKLKGKEHFQGVTIQPMIRLEGYELILGSSVDRDFGSILLFGSGGQLVEVYKDRALGLPPLNTALAKQMMAETKIYEALHGVRGRKAVDTEKLAEVLVAFSNLIARETEIAECDINPLLASPERLLALDARVILHPPGERVPKNAIRPYPVEYVHKVGALEVRPIRPEDEQRLDAFLKALSVESLKQRFLEAVHYDEVTRHDRLVRALFLDFDRELALVALEKEAIVAVGRWVRTGSQARFALVVRDGWQKRGIGCMILEQLIASARREGIQSLEGVMLAENKGMEHLCRKLGFTLKKVGAQIEAHLKLSP